MLEKMRKSNKDILDSIRDEKAISKETEESLKKFFDDFMESFE